MKKNISIIIILLFISFFATAQNRIKVPEYSVEKESTVYRLFKYVLQQCEDKGIAINDGIPFSINIYKRENNDYYIMISKSPYEDKSLQNGSYCGFITFDNLMLFIRGNDTDIYRECNSPLTKKSNFTNVGVNNPVADGTGQTWSFVMKDGEVYFIRYHDGIW